MENLTPTPVNDLGASNVVTLAQSRIYMGEVLSAFTTKTLMKNFVMVKQIFTGTSGRFPITNVGKDTDVKTHTAGQDVSVNALEMGERNIELGGLLYDARFIDQTEKKTLDFDITAPVTKAIGTSLAQKLDITLLTLLKTGVKTEGISGQADGSWVFNASISDTALTREQRGNALIDALLEASTVMDNNDVADEGRIFITTPSDWQSISQASKTRNKDFTTTNGGIDVYSFDVIKIGNIMVVKSNNLLKALTASVGGAEGFRGFLFTTEAIGLLQFIDVITEATYLPEKFGTLFTGRFKYGAGILNPSLIVGVRDTDTALV